MVGNKAGNIEVGIDATLNLGALKQSGTRVKKEIDAIFKQSSFTNLWQNPKSFTPLGLPKNFAKSFSDASPLIKEAVGTPLIQSTKEWSNQFRTSIKRVGTDFSTEMKQMKGGVTSFSKDISNSFSGSKIGFNASMFKGKDLKTYNKYLADLTSQFGGFIPKQTLAAEAIRRTSTEISKSKTQFQGWALSIMFLGMAIQSTLMSIAKSGVSTFQDVMHSVGKTVTIFDTLNGAITFLSFTVGYAISSILSYKMTIIYLIEGIANFILEFPRLSGWILITAGIIAGFLIILGMGVLGFLGLAEAFLILKELELGKFFMGIWAWITATAAATWAWVAANAVVILQIGVLIVVVLGLIALAITFKYAWKQVIEGYALKFQWLQTFLQSFWAWFAYQIDVLAIIFDNLGLNVKAFFIGIANYIGSSFSAALETLRKMVLDFLIWLRNALGRFGGWVNPLIAATKAVKFEFTPITLSPEDQAQMAKQLEAIAAAKAKYDELAYSIEMARNAVEKLMEENEKLGYANIAKSWLEVLDLFKKQQEDIKNTIGTDITTGEVTTGNTNNNNNSTSNNNFNINITQNEGESSQDFLNRLLAEINRRTQSS